MKYDIKKPIQMRIDELEDKARTCRRERQWDDGDRYETAALELRRVVYMIENLEEGGLL